jgi:predicted CoA-binding protein
MAGLRPTRAQINEFLGQKKIAIVGVSRNPRDFTRMLYTEFRRRGYDVVPINPAISEVDGTRCYASVQDAKPISAALLMTPPEITERVAEDCIAAGVRHLWMYRATGKGAISEEAAKKCREKGMNVISGECPFMYFPQPGFIHRAHGWVKMIVRSYPA